MKVTFDFIHDAFDLIKIILLFLLHYDALWYAPLVLEYIVEHGIGAELQDSLILITLMISYDIPLTYFI